MKCAGHEEGPKLGVLRPLGTSGSGPMAGAERARQAPGTGEPSATGAYPQSANGTIGAIKSGAKGAIDARGAKGALGASCAIGTGARSAG